MNSTKPPSPGWRSSVWAAPWAASPGFDWYAHDGPGADVDAVDQAQVDDVDAQFGVDHVAQQVEHQMTRALASEGRTMTTASTELDVRQEIPARRHELIFTTYGSLAAGEHFVLVNDHDPKPLYYQFAAEHADQFTWEYLEQGPEVWKVRIGRTAG
nr:DUF2249 domain-containing protein [Streptomyces naganishii]